MEEVFNKILIDPLEDFITILSGFLPRLISALVIFILGLFLGRVFKKVAEKTLKMLSAEKFFHRAGVSTIFEKGGIKETPTAFIGKICNWLLIVTFSIIALYTLSLPAIEVLMQKFLLYLPNFFIAVLIVIAGFIFGNFVETAVLIASVNAGIKFSKLLSYGVKFMIILLASTMALEQLGIGHDTVLVTFTLIFGGMIFTLSLAFGLAGKEIALKYLEKIFKENDDSKRIQHL
jgi:hypothetical protein